jgi:S-adenosylmethionine:tRNA ribosyltransferase-isomerase
VSEPERRTTDYDFTLPRPLIAQAPLPDRDASRLLVLERATGAITHTVFRSLPDLMRDGDALVVNTSKVIRARLLGQRASGARAEILLLHPLGGGRFEAMVSPGGKLRPGRRVHIGPGLDVEILALTERRTRVVRLVSDEPVEQAIERHGHVPLPPYITRPDLPADSDRYQTVYANEPGSAAAPTAGLHFTPALLATLESRGVVRLPVVLHVGAGTFKPVETEYPAQHIMHEESFDVPTGTADALNLVRERRGDIWAVGTTSMRTLESAVRDDGRFTSLRGETSLFIRPGFRFRAVDKLITNFHLPRSTLLMLVAAFAGYEHTMRAYREAVDAGYRFFSYGDAMAVV